MTDVYHAPVPPERGVDRRRRIAALVIDDDVDARELIADAIAKAGYTVATAADGKQALELLRTVCPSVIFLDLSMPVMTGAEFREAQRRDREWLAIPTIVMTGTSDEPLLDLAIEETLHKPIRARQVVEIVRRFAGHKPVG